MSETIARGKLSKEPGLRVSLIVSGYQAAVALRDKQQPGHSHYAPEMASPKLEAVRHLFELFNRLPADPELRATSTDIEEMLDLFDPELEWVPPSMAPGMAPSHGREELREFWLDWLSDWQVHRFDPEEIIERGDQVLALLRNRLRGRDGIEFEAGVGVIFTFRGEKILRGAVYLDQNSARQEFEDAA